MIEKRCGFGGNERMPCGQAQLPQSESQSAPQSFEESLLDSWSQHAHSSARASVAAATASSPSGMSPASCVTNNARMQARIKPHKRTHLLVENERRTGRNTTEG